MSTPRSRPSSPQATATLAETLGELLAKMLPTTELERGSIAQTAPGFRIEALSRMNDLEKVVRSSLPAPPQPSAAAPAAQAPAAPVRFESSRPEYRPALQDPSLIAALMALQPQAQPRPAARPSNAPPAPSQASEAETVAVDRGGNDEPSRQAEFKQDFSTPRIPTIDAVPKATPLLPGSGQRSRTILRPGRT